MAVATSPLTPHELSVGELAVYDGLVGVLRRHDWLLGRAALKAVLDGADTAEVTFPHGQLSLTHAGGVAVAIAADGQHVGVGVDFEPHRPTDPRTARFFLHEDERADHDLLRLWTVKEALLKATPANDGAQLLDYHLDDTAVTTGSATDRRGHTFRYRSTTFGDGHLTVAVCSGRADVPV